MQAVRSFIQAVRDGNPAECWEAWKYATHRGVATSAMRAASRLSEVSRAVQNMFLEHWILQGDTIRCLVNDDLVLMDGLRKLLPRYRGPGRKLYRGDAALNLRRRQYGLSWSADKDVARHFAQGTWQMLEGGSVLLEVDAPVRAIISTDALVAENHDEAEYVVDRRQLRSVRVVERFSQRLTYPSL